MDVNHPARVKYLSSVVNILAADVVEAAKLDPMKSVCAYANGDVSISVLHYDPVQPGQSPWVGS